MADLSTYRRLLIRVQCPDADQPIEWEYPTTRTDAEVLEHAANVGRMVCRDKSPYHSDSHTVEIVADVTATEGKAHA